MKRTYTKPELFCEEYELSVSIAANCSESFNRGSASHNEPYTCFYQIGRVRYFASSEVCMEVRDNGQIQLGNELICYQQPTEDMTVFLS